MMLTVAHSSQQWTYTGFSSINVLSKGLKRGDRWNLRRQEASLISLWLQTMGSFFFYAKYIVIETGEACKAPLYCEINFVDASLNYSVDNQLLPLS